MTNSTRRFSGGTIKVRDEWRRAIRTVLGGLVALCAVVLLASCGSDSGGNPASPSPAPTAAPPTPRMLQQGSIALSAPTADSVFFALTTVTDPVAGRWETTVDWTNEANTLWMWVADGVCTVEQFAKPECPDEVTCPCRFAIRSETATPKPRVLNIPGAAGGTRTLIVANLGPREENAQYRVMLTPSGIQTGESAPTRVSTAGSLSGVSIGRKTAMRRP